VLLEYITPLFIIKSLGTVGILGVSFVENAIPIGGVLPWDSLLFVLGLVLSQGKILSVWIWQMLIGLWISAILWSLAWYYRGYLLKNKINHNKKQRRYNHKMIQAADTYFDRHGKYAIIFSKFTPYIRSVVPMICGIIHYPLKDFIINTAIGTFLWIGVFVWGWYTLSQIFPGIKDYIEIISFGILVIALLPIIWQLIQRWYKKHKK